MDATEVREHLAMLAEAGVGLTQVTRLTGVSGGSLCKLVYGVRRDGVLIRPPSRRVRRETRDKLLAVMPAHRADGATVDARPVWHNVEKLLAKGWTKTAIAARCGQTSPSLQLSRRRVTAGNARVIAGLLSEPVPPRRSRWGVHEQPQVDEVAERRDAMRRRAEADRRAEYRAAERGPVELPVAAVMGEWVSSAACRLPTVPTWLFFADTRDAESIAAAKKVCSSCRVRVSCLEAALEGDEEGVWGGLTDRERSDLTVEHLSDGDDRAAS